MSTPGQKSWVESRALLQRGGQTYLIVRPTNAEECPWEFPGGPLRKTESPEAALRRICREVLGVAIDIAQGQPPVEHAFGTHTVTYRYYLCGVARGEAAALGVAEVRWVLRKQLCEYVFAEPMRPIVDWLLSD
jgi:8-oxo-dGTP diphosphatase